MIYPKMIYVPPPSHFPSMCIKMTQHPVGHGGLFSGDVIARYGGVRWVYDCGSVQISNLNTEIIRVISEGGADVLFISHLDNDHVNGIDTLLRLHRQHGRPIRTVMLPYFSSDISLAIMTKSGARGSLSPLFIRMNQDIREWFESHGVKRIIYVDSNTDGYSVPPVESFDDDDDERGAVIRVGRETLRDPWPSDPIQEVHKPNADIMILIGGQNRTVSFVLIPYAHNPDPYAMKNFKRSLVAAFGSADRSTVIAAAKDPRKRKILKTCYNQLWGNNNLVSMSLYCGPVFKATSQSLILKGNRFYSSTEYGGCILTGDSDLHATDRRNKFINYYNCYIPNVSFFMLPHHGSNGSFHSDLLVPFVNTQLFYATAKPGSTKFPHPNVVKVLRQAKRKYRTVGTKSYSRITLTGIL